MTRMRVGFAVGLLAATLLSGCVIVPRGGWGYRRRGDYYQGHGGGGYSHYQYQSPPYRPYSHPGP